MSCDAAALAASLHLASYDPAEASPRLMPALSAAMARATNPLAREPLFASIVADAGRLRARVDAVRKAGVAGAAVAALDAPTQALAALDMKGHVELAARGTDGDLKCILKGIAQDLPRKLAAVRAAPDAPARKAALDEFWYLLRDNVEVVTSPPGATSTDAAAVAG